MKILYSLPHPADRLGTQRAGHIIRATALLDALENLGHQIVRLEAASNIQTAFNVSIYRKSLRRLLPPPLALILRDHARIEHGKKFARQLIAVARQSRPDLILETHIAFSLSGKIASNTTGIPFVLDDCSPSWEEKQQYGVGLGSAAVKIHREVTGYASLLTAVNDTMRHYLIDEGVPSGKIITVENGFDAFAFHPRVDGKQFRKDHHIPNDSIVIVFVGSFQPYHRVDMLIESFNQLYRNNNIHLLLVGDGQGLEDARNLVAQLGLIDRVTFTGRVPYSDVPRCLAAGDIAVMPATNAYGNPMKVYEYMALGKVVVAPNQPTITEIATQGENAILFEPDSVAALTQALVMLISDNKLRKRIADQGEKYAVNHTWGNRAKVLENGINSVIFHRI